MILGAGRRWDTGSGGRRWWEQCSTLTKSNFCSTTKASSPQGEGWGTQMEDTDLYYYICHRAGEGDGGPDNLRVKGGMSDQAGRHLAFLRLLLPTCFFRLQENSHFLFHLSIHHSQSITAVCLLYIYKRRRHRCLQADIRGILYCCEPYSCSTLAPPDLCVRTCVLGAALTCLI